MLFDGKTFAHRHNHNGSYDAICLSCFLTIGNRSTEEELREDEEVHRCRPEDILLPSKPSVAGRVEVRHSDGAPTYPRSRGIRVA